MVALLQSREMAQSELTVARKKIEVEAAKAKEESEKALASQGAAVGSSQERSERELPSHRGKCKTPAGVITHRRAACRPNPIGRRPITRQ
jgi:hypothetical protein